MNLGPKEIDFENSIIKTAVYHGPYIHPHRHSTALEVVLCLSGKVYVKAAEDEFVLIPGQLCCVNYGEYHCIFCDGQDSSAIVLHIDLQSLQSPWELLRTYFYYIEAEDMQMPEYYALKDILLTLLLDHYSRGGQNADILANKMISVLTDHFDWYDRILQSVPASSRAIFRDRFIRIQEYIFSNHADKIYLKDIAAAEHLSESYLSQLLGNTEFLGFNNTVNSARCRSAERYMFETDMSLLQISQECGFSDPKYFYKQFTKEWGVKPGVYRKWFANFIETPEHIQELDPDKTIELLHRILIEHHMEKYDSAE